MDEDLQPGLEGLAAEYGLLAIYVFGSRAEEVAARPVLSRSYAALWRHCLILGATFWPGSW